MARIVQASNFDKEWFNETFILWPMNDYSAKIIATTLNRDSVGSGEYYYKVVDDDYKLYLGMNP